MKKGFFGLRLSFFWGFWFRMGISGNSLDADSIFSGCLYVNYMCKYMTTFFDFLIFFSDDDSMN